MTDGLIDNFASPEQASNGARWRFFSDTVMGGVSGGSIHYGVRLGRNALQLRGDVSLANNGGFVQMAIDLASDGSTIDASAFSGIQLSLCGDGASYGVHLRSSDVQRPWQSYRARVTPETAWRDFKLPFSAFLPHRLTAALDTRCLYRIGLVAIGRAGPVDLAISDLRFY